MYSRKFEILMKFFIILIIILIIKADSKTVDNKDLTNSISNTDFILVITLDGTLYAIGKYSGEIKWSFKEKSLLSNNPSKSFQDNPYFLIDPRYGHLYMNLNQRDRIKKFPYTIAELVNTSPSKTLDGLLFTGDKNDEWLTIDYRNGLNLDTLTSKEYTSKIPTSDEKILYLGRTKYTISMFDMNTRKKLFNLSYFDYSTHSNNNILNMNSILRESHSDNSNYYQFYHFTSSSDGSVVTLDKNNGDFVWTQKLDSPVISIYRFKNENLQKVDFNIFGNEELKNIDFLYRNINSLNKNDENLKIIETNQFENSMVEKFYIGLHKNNFYALPTKVFDFEQEKRSNDLEEKWSRNSVLLGHHNLPEKLNLPSNYIQTNSKFILVSENNDDINLLIDSFNDGSSLCLTEDLNKFSSINNSIYYYILHYDLFNGELSQFYFLFLFSAIIVIIFLVSKLIKKPTKISDKSIDRKKSKSSSMTKSKESKLNGSVQIITQISSKEKKDSIQIGKIEYDPKEIIGHGCGGTIIYKGKYENRPVAVKRLLSQCFNLAEKEVDMLRDADQHKNVIRYFCTENDSQFKYIAIELCQMTLHDYVHNKNDLICQGKYSINTLNILEQATKGLNHLHMLGIVHRDIKPQNILLTYPDQKGFVSALISDFGLCKRLKLGNNSFTKKSSIIGTDGWTARELLSRNDSIQEQLKKVNKSVDIFSLGCVYYYALSGGYHPFGDSFLRQANIINNEFRLEKLSYSSNCELYMQKFLVEEMISNKPDQRPTTNQLLTHPIFWTKAKMLQFLQDVSDRLEKVDQHDSLSVNLEKNANVVLKNNWKTYICSHLQADLKKFRAYNGVNVRDLLRAIRNKKHHYRELPDEVKNSLGSLPNEFIDYFTTRFPKLLLHVYNVMKPCQNESMLNVYYQVKENLV
jgi:serine/threonine-protein kinase/endoribonuclease IRE1